MDKQPQLPDDIQWHFIGHLQSKKSNMLLGEFIVWALCGRLSMLILHT